MLHSHFPIAQGATRTVTHRTLRSFLPLTGLIALGLAACDGSSEAMPEFDYELEPAVTFGDPGTGDEAGPDVLGSAIAALWSPAGVFVLDQQASRFVWFDASGASLGTAGRSGDGPGEFRLARHIALRADSLVSGLDYETGRVTTFRVPSMDVHDVTSGLPSRGFHHAWVGDTIWVVRPNVDGPTSPLATAHLASSGSEVATAPPSHPDDQPYGGAFGLASSETRLVTSTRRPGVWWERRDGAWRRVGQPLFPDAPPEQRVEIAPRSFRVIPSPASAADIAILGDSIILQRFVLQPGVQEAEDPRDVPRELYLGVFSVGGEHLATLEIDSSTSCLAAATGDSLLLCTWDPFPQVGQYRLVRAPRAGVGPR